jgi:outer membrane protein TolC
MNYPQHVFSLCRPFLSITTLLAALLAATGVAASAYAQPTSALSEAASTLQAPLGMTVDEAVQLALIGNPHLRQRRIDMDRSRAQVRTARGQLLPQVHVGADYIHHLRAVDPFLGSPANDLFAGFTFVDWLAFNEAARTDADPATAPLTLDDFQGRQMQQSSARGTDLSLVTAHQFVAEVTVTQTLYDSAVRAAIRGAKRLQDVHRHGVEREEQLVVDRVRAQFYAALLAQARVQTIDQRLARTEATHREIVMQVRQGAAPKVERLAAEVQVANQESRLMEAQDAADAALEVLMETLGVPAGQSLHLHGTLEIESPINWQTVSVRDAVSAALASRPDLHRATLAVELSRIDLNATRASRLPTVSAVGSMGLVGHVPDDRTAGAGPGSQEASLFGPDYWAPALNVGLRLSWDLFSGRSGHARSREKALAVDQAVIDRDALHRTIERQVTQALRTLRLAQQRLVAQSANVAQADLAYTYAARRLREGVGAPYEEREASDLLDESRLSHLQAAHDYLRARSAFQTAIGQVWPSEDALLALLATQETDRLTAP